MNLCNIIIKAAPILGSAYRISANFCFIGIGSFQLNR